MSTGEPAAKRAKSSSKEADLALFNGIMEKLTAEIKDMAENEYEMPEDAAAWIGEMTTYTVSGGKMIRGLTVLHAARTMLEGAQTPLQEEEACILGNCIEWLQAFFLVADDVMDNSKVRRGKPCWYRVGKVGMTAINDSFILESSLYMILRRHFGKHKSYHQFCDLFREVTWQTELGQLLDCTSQPLDGPMDLTRFTLKRYKSIVKYKTAFYTFYLPVALAMVLSGVDADAEKEKFEQARDICLAMGEYFQIQDDFLDCYGDPEVIGKVGTDIEEAKCGWLAVQALPRCSAEQKQVFKENYGKEDAKCVAVIKALYVDLGLADVYKALQKRGRITTSRTPATAPSTS